MKVFTISAPIRVDGKWFKLLLTDQISLFSRSALGPGEYFQQAFVGNLIARVNVQSAEDVTSAVVTMFVPGRIESVGECRLMVRNDKFEVKLGESKNVHIGNIEFTFEFVDVG